MAYCGFGESCIMWMERYLVGCVGGLRDDISLVFGLISVVSWAVAEIPQIFTNFISGSTEGVSLAFLMTWVVGDLFNLIGCLLEPATLPTQFYTALVYTISTVVLVGQSLYYDHFSKWWKSRKANSSPQKWTNSASKLEPAEHTEPVNVPESRDYSSELAKKNNADHVMKSANGTPASSLPIPTFSPARERSNERNMYYTSARSLASSDTPTRGSYLAASSRGSGRSGPSYILDQSSVDDEGLLANTDYTSPKGSKSMLRSVAATVFFVGGLNYFNLEAIPTFDSTKIVSRASFVLTGRKILQEASTITLRDTMVAEETDSVVGTWLGWVMAAIYMGGRFPQIIKNVRRGTVEGLNPLMFLFALIGNAAYVGSILVKSLEWKELKPNMPWIVDAAVCVLLDCFILSQFFYYKIRNPDEHDNNAEEYEEIKP